MSAKAILTTFLFCLVLTIHTSASKPIRPRIVNTVERTAAQTCIEAGSNSTYSNGVVCLCCPQECCPCGSARFAASPFTITLDECTRFCTSEKCAAGTYTAGCLGLSTCEAIIKEAEGQQQSARGVSPDCFPSDAQVEVQGKGLLPMAKLQIGDRVKVAGGHFSTIYTFSHKQQNAIMSAIAIMTATGKKLVASPGHYVYAQKPFVSNSIQLVSMRHLQVSDLVEVASGDLEQVVSIELLQAKGLYNPHTVSGDIIVNEFRASCYTEAVRPEWARALLFPVQWFYHLFNVDILAPWLHADNNLLRNMMLALSQKN